MPSNLAGIVRIAIREYVNLNNVELMNHYSGPILLIRRTEDEVISQYVQKKIKLLDNFSKFLFFFLILFTEIWIYRLIVVIS